MSNRKDEISRTPFKLVKLTLDYCSRTFGISPCTAAGAKCYNTFFTCGDREHYSAYIEDPIKGKIYNGKTYNFVSANININLLTISAPELIPVRPYIKEVSIRPTELSEEKTITSQATIDLLDEPDADINIDPYWSDRGYANIESVKGTFWKKFFARNPNYKRGTVEIYDGFLGDSDITCKFKGKVKEISRSKDGSVRIECGDFLESLNDIKYPINCGMKLAEPLPATFTALNETEMIGIDAKKNDLCIRKDFLPINNLSIGGGEEGHLVIGDHLYYVIAYDSWENPFAQTSQYFRNVEYIRGNEWEDDTIVELPSAGLQWTGAPGASYYKIYRSSYPDNSVSGFGAAEYLGTTVNLSYTDIGQHGGVEEPPKYAVRYYKLKNDNPKLAANWEEYHQIPAIIINETLALDSIGTTSGYVKIDDEIIFYSERTGNSLIHLIRGAHNSNSGQHPANADVKVIVKQNVGNPFQHLLNLLALAKIPAVNINQTRFDEYISSWDGINFSILEVLDDMKLSDIYFDLVNALDCYSWVNENGQIDIKYKSDKIFIKALSDSDIIKDSASVEVKDDDRITCIIYKWDRKLDKLDESLNEPEAYLWTTQTQDLDLEKIAYGDQKRKTKYTAWVNVAGNTESSAKEYMRNLCRSILSRYEKAPTKFYISVELKDMDIKTADVVMVATNEIQDVNGGPLTEALFRVMKREPDGDNKIKLTMELING